MPSPLLTAFAKRFPLTRLLRDAWKVDIDHAAEQMQKEIARLTRAIERLEANQQTVVDRAERMERHAQQLKEAARLDDKHRALVATLDRTLDLTRVAAHVRQSIARATLTLDPFPHIVAESLMPEDIYRLTVSAIPPEVFFGQKDPVKQNIRIPMDFGPVLSTRVWDFVDLVAREAIRPAILEKFAEPLTRHLEALFGPELREQAASLPQAVAGGRLMLRREGYHLDPHRDPKRALVTCLLYFARPRDSEAFGTQIFRVHNDREANYQETYYPERNGGQVELVTVVPYRPNTAVMFLNSGGAHGVDIPTSFEGVERHSFQFYIGPDQEALDAVIAGLPADRQSLWRGRADVSRM